MSRMRMTTGFTLPELLVAVSAIFLLVGAVATVQLPMGSAEPDSYAADAVRGSMQRARLEAIRNARPCRLVVDTSEGRMAIFADETLLYDRRLDGGVRFSEGTAETLEIEFDRHGRLSGSGGHLEVTYGGDLYRVSVFRNGSTGIARWDGLQWVPEA